MKKYKSKDILSMEPIKSPFEFRTHLPETFGEFLKKVLKHDFSSRIIHVFLAVAIIVIVPICIRDEKWSKIIALSVTLLISYSKMIWQYHNLYKDLNSHIYYRFDKHGVSAIGISGTIQTRLVTDGWDLVEKIYEYDDLIVVELNEKCQTANAVHIIGEDKQTVLNNLIGFWQAHLNGLAPKDMDDYYSMDEMEEVQNFIESQFGEIECIAHETMSTGIHVDIAVIKPTEERPYYTLCTMGVGAYRMTMDEDDRTNNYIAEYYEYSMHLPPNWNVYDEGFEKEENWWPTRLLKTVACEGKFSDTRLRINEIVSYNDFNETAKACDAYLDYPLPDPAVLTSYTTSTGRTINFLQVVPISNEEAFHFDDREDSVDYYEKSSYYYGFDTKSAEEMEENERIDIYTKHILNHFNELIK